MLKVTDTGNNAYLVNDTARDGTILVDMSGPAPKTRSITWQRNIDPTSGDGLSAVEAVQLHLDHHPTA